MSIGIATVYMQYGQNKKITSYLLLYSVYRGRQRYSKNVTALYVIAFGLVLERNFKKR
jgi:hypothetical protein